MEAQIKIRALDGSSDIAQSVEFAVGGSDLGSLANHGAAAGSENAAKLGKRKVHVESGNGFQFVERAAGMSEAAAADHGNDQAAGRDQRRQDQRSFVADSAGRMLVYFLRGELGEIQHVARVQHGVGQHGGFGSRQSTQDHGHKPGGNLIVGNLAAGVSADQIFDLRWRKLLPVALLANDVDGTNGLPCLRPGHLRRNPSGRSSVMWLSFQPFAAWK